jgi:putative glutamine amidotransferase
MMRIAIPVPTLGDAAYNERSWTHYAQAVLDAGAEPVEVPLTASRAEQLALAASCHGICLPGSPADVDPARFGADRDPACAAADPSREALDFLLLDHAEATGKPLLGICFGVQSMNVWRGGSLVQDILPVPVNHSAGSAVAVAHVAVVSRESLLATLLDPAEAAEAGDFLRLPVNSSHHQAVAAPGEGLRIVARCPDDGVIEAIEADPAFASGPHSDRFLLGVQWHPERSTAISPTSRALFARLASEASNWARAHSTAV